MEDLREELEELFSNEAQLRAEGDERIELVRNHSIRCLMRCDSLCAVLMGCSTVRLCKSSRCSWTEW